MTSWALFGTNEVHRNGSHSAVRPFKSPGETRYTRTNNTNDPPLPRQTRHVPPLPLGFLRTKSSLTILQIEPGPTLLAKHKQVNMGWVARNKGKGEVVPPARRAFLEVFETDLALRRRRGLGLRGLVPRASWARTARKSCSILARQQALVVPRRQTASPSDVTRPTARQERKRIDGGSGLRNVQ